MAESRYKPNSQKSKIVNQDGSAPPEPEKPKVEKIISGQAKERKKPIGKRISETFTGDDAQSVGSYLLLEVVVPAVKSLISEAVSQGTDRMLYGDAPRMVQGGRRSGYRTPSGYNRPSSPNSQIVGSNRTDPRGGQRISSAARATHDFREILLPTRGDAELVLETLQSMIDEYSQASVSDLYSLTGITPDFVDLSWGWTSLQGARVVRHRGEFLLDMPATEAL